MHFIQQNIWLVTLAVVSGVMLVWPEIERRLSGVRHVGVLEATQLINQRDALVLDVREDKEFATGHIPNSKHIPLGQLGTRLTELAKYKARPIVVNCRSGARSARACGALGKQGFGEVYVLTGGMMAWEQANLPVAR
ncbi:MAG: rhodanese-like domain-containing protein [Betaproteobacteria bacterium]|nr:rhodanese-like domain-containing protein [Betaproteobacteria bacterium]